MIDAVTQSLKESRTPRRIHRVAATSEVHHTSVAWRKLHDVSCVAENYRIREFTGCFCPNCPLAITYPLLMTIPHTQPATWPTDLPPARFAAHIQQAMPTACKVALLGLPDDLGVRLNNGRPGAAEGPRAFREALTKYGVAHPASGPLPRVFDAGDVIPATGTDAIALNETHNRVTEATRAILKLGLFPIAIGGGHDLTFAFARGVLEHLRSHVMPARTTPTAPHVLYFDAHLDVRDTAGSGMPFRRIAETCGVRSFAVVGAKPSVNSAEHAAYFASIGGRVVTHQSHALPAGTTDVLVSLDLDALDASHAPGVSAINPAGLSSLAVEQWIAWCAANPLVRCFDIMELSPPHDDNNRTARVAAHMFYTFLQGLATRPGFAHTGGVA
jgi:arginase family enzyme